MHLEIIFKDPNRKKIFLSKTKTLCAVILSYHLLTWFTGCPFRFFFGISCPGCGMTRALLAALRLDFAAAFSYHPLFFLLPFFLLAMYEKNGQPLEKILRNMIRVCFLRPRQRPYKTKNFYAVVMRQNQLDREVYQIVNGKAKTDPRREKTDRGRHRQGEPDR